MKTFTLAPPIVLCGRTPDGRWVLGGAFQMADTLGVPLGFAMDQAEAKSCVMSLPHYFASAMEAGWDDGQTFSKIREALVDRGQAGAMELIMVSCRTLFMAQARAHPHLDARQLGRLMREDLEAVAEEVPT